MKKFFGFLIAVTFLASAVSVVGQKKLDDIDAELVGLYQEIENWSAYRPTYDGDKLSVANKAFRKALLKYTSIERSTINFEFQELKDFLKIVTSSDGRFRIYSWDTHSGGTMHFYENVFQYIGRDGKVHAKGNSEEGNANGFFTEISSLQTRTGKIYLATSTSVLSTSLRGQTILLFRIGKKTLSNPKMIKTRSGMTDSIGFSYDFFSVVDRSKRPNRLFEYDEKTRKIKFPVVIENKKFRQGEVTKRKITYWFNGKYFVKVRR